MTHPLLARALRGAVIVVGVALFACGADEAEPPAASGSPGAPPAGVVDSIFPIEEEIRRFRAVLGPEPTALSGGEISRDALVDRFIAAVAQSDTAALADMLMTVDEFGWLYYPHTRFTAPPYELPPGLVWFQIENASSRGLGRLVDRLGGRPLAVLGYVCAAEPSVEGPNRLWKSCLLRVDRPDADAENAALFGSILERDGIFKFVSYANDY